MTSTTVKVQNDARGTGIATACAQHAHVVVAVILFVAAGLKAHHLFVSPFVGTGVVDSYLTRVAIIECEVLLACWLLSGCAEWLARRVTIGVMVILALASLFKVIDGAESCGCFGVLKVSPWITFVFDVLIIAYLLRWRPGEIVAAPFHTLAGLTSRVQGVVVSAMLWLSLIFIGIAVERAPRRDVHALIDSDQHGQVVLLEPETWVNQQLPVAQHIEGADLSSGSWLVIFYHNGCGRCQSVISEFQRIAVDWRARSLKRSIAFIDVPQTLGIDSQLVPSGDSFTSGQLSNTHTWLMTTPVAVVVDNGLIGRVFLHKALESAECIRRTVSELESSAGAERAADPKLD